MLFFFAVGAVISLLLIGLGLVVAIGLYYQASKWALRLLATARNLKKFDAADGE